MGVPFCRPSTAENSGSLLRSAAADAAADAPDPSAPPAAAPPPVATLLAPVTDDTVQSRRRVAFNTQRVFRTFISSTFRDLGAERRHLQRHVFPRVRDLCLAAGWRFFPVDLRWGIPRWASTDHTAVEVCIREIDRCRELTPRPNFLVLLADRYGWRPLAASIAAPEFERLVAAAAEDAPDDAALVREYYRRDANSVPPAYKLWPIDAKFPGVGSSDAEESGRAWQEWGAVEERLHAVLERAGVRAGLTEHELMRYQTSVTEQEIFRGVLNAPESAPYVSAFVRTIDNPPEASDPFASDYFDVIDGEFDPHAREKRLALRKKLDGALREGAVRSYSARWLDPGDRDASGPVTLDHLEQFGNDVYSMLEAIIKEEIDASVAAEDQERDAAAQLKFCLDRSRVFVGQADPLARILEFGTVASDSGRMLIVHGPSGSGKTSLMARAVRQLLGNAPTTSNVVFRFIGGSASSSDGRLILQSLLAEISALYPGSVAANADEVGAAAAADNDDDSDAQEAGWRTATFDALSAAFIAVLQRATAEAPLVLFLDALDQLSAAYNARGLSWISLPLPPHVRIVTSVLEGVTECLEVLRRKAGNADPTAAEFLQVEPMPKSEAHALLDTWLANSSRQVTEEQSASLLSAYEACPYPLYLRLAYGEAQRWASWDVGIANGLPRTMVGIIEGLFERLCRDHIPAVVWAVLALLSQSRRGLTEDEIVDLLTASDSVMGAITEFHRPDPVKLPTIVWSRLYLDMAPFLSERQSQGAVLLSFYHRQFWEAVGRAVATRVDLAETSRVLADYFSGRARTRCAVAAQPLWFGPGRPNLRRISEHPHALLAMGPAATKDLTALLCDLEFVEAKCTGGLLPELLADYERAAELPAGPDVAPFRAFLVSEAQTLSKRPQLVWQQASNLFSGHPVRAAASRHPYPFQEVLNRPIEPSPCQRVLEGHVGQVSTVAPCPADPDDGSERIITSGADGGVKLWHLSDGQVRRVFEGHRAYAYTAGMTRDGQYVVSAGSADQRVTVFDAVTGEQMHQLRGTKRGVHSLIFDGSGRLFARCDPDRLQVVDAVADRVVFDLPGRFGFHTTRKFSKDSEFFITRHRPVAAQEGMADPETLKIFRIADGALVSEIADVSKLSCMCINSKLSLIGAGADSTSEITIFRSESGGPEGPWRRTAMAGTHPPVVSMRFRRDERVVAAACKRARQQSVKIFDVDSGELVHTLGGLAFAVTVMEFAPDPHGHLLAAGSVDRTIRIWDTRSGETFAVLRGHANEIRDFFFAATPAPAAIRLISASADSTVREWLVPTDRRLRAPLQHSAGVNTSALAVRGSSAVAVTGASDGTAIVWTIDRSSGSQAPLSKLLTDHTNRVTGVAVSARYVVTVGSDKVIRAYDLDRDLDRVMVLGGSAEDGGSQTGPCSHTGGINGCKLVGDDTLVTVGNDKTVRAWRIPGGAEIEPAFKTDEVPSGVSVAGGRALVYSWHDSRAFLLRVGGDAGVCLERVLEGAHKGLLRFAQLSADGRFAVTCSVDCTAVLWPLEGNGKPIVLATFDSHVRSAGFAPDSRTVAAGSRDGTVQIFATDDGRRLRRAVLGSAVFFLSYYSADALVAGGAGRTVYVVAVGADGEDTQGALPTGGYITTFATSAGTDESSLWVAGDSSGRVYIARSRDAGQ